MEFQKSVIELIKMRTSCRSYNGRDIENIALQKLEGYIKEINEEAKIKLRFVFINSKDINAGKINNVSIPSYPVTKGALDVKSRPSL